MIIVAPDKFKGTLSAEEAASAIHRVMLHDAPVVVSCPMSDGGEGTAALSGRFLGLKRSVLTGYDALREPREVEFYSGDDVAYMDSASSIGLQYLLDRKTSYDPWDASSYGLGDAILKLIGNGFHKLIIGVGGTACCDGGMGLVEALPQLPPDVSLQFLADVDLPLLPVEDGGMSGLTFMRQKGFSSYDEPLMFDRLKDWIERSNGNNNWKYAGSGSGVGYGLTLIGGQGVSGAGYIWDMYTKSLPLDNVDMIVTGEGRFDRQSMAGKVTGMLIKEARRVGARPVVVAGCVDWDGLDRGILGDTIVVDLSQGCHDTALPTSEMTIMRMAAHTLS